MFTNPYYPNYYPAQVPSQNLPTPQQQTQQSNNVIWVQGEDAARAYMCAANSSVLLMDSDANRFYIKTADASGMPLPLRIFDFEERVQAPKTAQKDTIIPNAEFVTRAEFDALSARLDALMPKKTKKQEVNSDGESSL